MASVGEYPSSEGSPGYEDFLAERRGELVLGGCLAWEGELEWRCRACGHECDALRGRFGPFGGSILTCVQDRLDWRYEEVLFDLSLPAIPGPSVDS